MPDNQILINKLKCNARWCNGSIDCFACGMSWVKPSTVKKNAFLASGLIIHYTGRVGVPIMFPKGENVALRHAVSVS